MTTFHISGRQTGKTHEMIQWLRQHPDGVVIVHSRDAVDQFKKQFEETVRTKFPDSASVISANDSKKALEGATQVQHDRPVAVENLDLVLPMLLGRHRIDQVTATGHSVIQSDPVTTNRRVGNPVNL